MGNDKSNVSLPNIILKKYVSIWIWSILFGGNTGLIYSYMAFNYRGERWSYLVVNYLVKMNRYQFPNNNRY